MIAVWYRINPVLDDAIKDGYLNILPLGSKMFTTMPKWTSRFEINNKKSMSEHSSQKADAREMNLCYMILFTTLCFWYVYFEDGTWTWKFAL